MSTDNALVERLILPIRQKECQFLCLKSTLKTGRQNLLKCGLLWSAGFPPLLGGDLNPILGFCFPLFSMSFAREFPSGWNSVERSGIKTVVFL
jgi:hypothetical protein